MLGDLASWPLTTGLSGGAGNRTPVRAPIRARVYVRSLRFTLSASRRYSGNLLTAQPRCDLTACAEAPQAASLIFRYPSVASGGLHPGQVR